MDRRSNLGGVRSANIAVGKDIVGLNIQHGIFNSLITAGVLIDGSPQNSSSGGNIGPDGSGGVKSLNPDGVSAGQQLAAAVPPGARYVKAFGTLPAQMLDSTATESGDTPVLFYATDDDVAGDTVAMLIAAAGLEPVSAGGVEATSRIEMFGDLHPFGGLNGRVIGRDEALQLLRG